MRGSFKKNDVLVFLSYGLIIITIVFLIFSIYIKQYYVIPLSTFLIFYLTVLVTKIKKGIKK